MLVLVLVVVVAAVQGRDVLPLGTAILGFVGGYFYRR